MALSLILCILLLQSVASDVRADDVVPEPQLEQEGASCDSHSNCGECLQDSCRWCASVNQCQSKLSFWNKCEGSVTECPVAPPKTLDTCVLKPNEWKLASEAANLATLSGIDIDVGTNFEDRGLLKYQYEQDGFAVRLFQSNDKARCFIVFRGTEVGKGVDTAFSNVWADVKATVYTDHGLKTTDGFTNAVDAVEHDLVPAIKNAYSNGDCKAETTYVTGHSLGGAMANVAANRDTAQWGGDRSKGGLITFGSPRPWMQPCDSVLPKLPNLNWRFVRKVPQPNLGFGNFKDYPGFDLVPQLAPSLFPFNAHHCADRAIALNQNSYDDTPEGEGPPTSPTNLARNDPPDFFNALDFTPGVALIRTGVSAKQVWFIHNSKEYAVVTEKYANQASQCSSL